MRRGAWLATVRPIVLALVAGSPAGVAVAGHAAAADIATFGPPEATSSYGKSIDFRQPVTVTRDLERVEILIDVEGAPGAEAFEEQLPAAGTTSTTLDHRMAVSSGALLPNTKLSARWRLTATDGSVVLGPNVSVTYDDTRFDWKTRTGDLVRVHWYDGGEAFGQRAMTIGDRAVRETSELLGVAETEPIDFFVYADKNAFYDALGPGTRENVGGQANADIRTLFALITPGEIDAAWVGIVIPHELTHLVFNTAVDNPYHFPPRWLNEGLAVYLSEGYGSSDRSAVEDAARQGTLIPLGGLTGQFPTTVDRFSLAYSESVSAVDYLIRQYGKDALVSLIKSYARGLTDDEAFSGAIGRDTTAFDRAWRDELNAKDPVVYGPQDAPAGPLPPGWSGPAPGAAASARPGVNAPSAPSSPSATGAGAGWTIGAVVAVVLIGLLMIGLVLRRQRMNRPRPPLA